MLVKILVEDSPIAVEVNDAAGAAQVLYKNVGKNLLKMAKSSDHGKYLVDIGFENDLKTCVTVDSIPVLPLLIGNVIKLKKDEAKHSITLDVQEG
jgi:2-phosphosulfolactate phosphatase